MNVKVSQMYRVLEANMRCGELDDCLWISIACQPMFVRFAEWVVWGSSHFENSFMNLSYFWFGRQFGRVCIT